MPCLVRVKVGVPWISPNGQFSFNEITTGATLVIPQGLTPSFAIVDTQMYLWSQAVLGSFAHEFPLSSSGNSRWNQSKAWETAWCTSFMIRYFALDIDCDLMM